MVRFCRGLNAVCYKSVPRAALHFCLFLNSYFQFFYRTRMFETYASFHTRVYINNYLSFATRKRSYLSHRERSNSTSYVSSRLKYGAVMRKLQKGINSDNLPLVVILGWNDCKLKHLQKYSSIFEAKGWSTIFLPAKSFNTFFRGETKVKRIALYIAGVIKAQAKEDQPVFLYAFSNGGCGVYFHLVEALTTAGGTHYNSVNVIGSVFDSCPAKPTTESVKRAQRSITEYIKNPILRPIVWCSAGLILPFVIQNHPVFKRFFNDLGKMPLKCPHLFLYSKADSFIPWDEIEEHIDVRIAHGVKVFSKCWDDSQHVQHYIKYSKEYLKLLDEFVAICFVEQNYHNS